MIVSMGFPLALHVLSAVVWVGGMFFAYTCLRPSMAQLAPAERTALWSRTLGRFFGWVGAAIPLLLLSGFWMIHMEGGMAAAQLRVHLMLAIGVVMMLLFLHVLLAPYRRLRAAVAAGNVPLAAEQVGTIRKLVAMNLTLGIVVVLIATVGRYFPS
jgi:uncharacterized membrane protein